MARGKIIGPFEFPTKKEATTQIRDILHTAPLREPLAGDDLALISALVTCHPDAEEKIGAGIQSINVRIIEHGSRGFWITRTDGTVIDFSYRVCLNNSLAGHRPRVLDALRRGIDDQINDHRRHFFATTTEPRCPLTDQPLRPDQAHVDHEHPTFAELAATFIAAVGDPATIPTRAAPNGIGHVLANPTHLAAWQDFHRAKATLRVIHRSANSARYRRAAA